jgi:hypothetical protein
VRRLIIKWNVNILIIWQDFALVFQGKRKPKSIENREF